MAHRSRIASAAKNVGWFDQNWRYDYEVTWLAGNGSIREVKIDKTNGAAVVAGLRVTPRFPFLVRDPRRDIRAPTAWTLIVRPAQFEFMIQPPPMAPLANYIPPLAPPPPFAPAPPGGGPFTGQFRVYSVENPAVFSAFTVDHLAARFPALPNAFRVQAPNTKPECAEITAACDSVKGGYRYTYVLSSEFGDLWQMALFLHPDVKIRSIESSDEAWQTYRVGFDTPRDKKRADGEPTQDERGVLYFGSFSCPVSAGGGAVSLRFVSGHEPGLISVLANGFSESLVGPVPASDKKPKAR